MRDKSVGISHGTWRGLEALILKTPRYEAVLLPKHGSNVVRLYDKELDLDILRTPAKQEMETFLQLPHIFGHPILFFPNRIKDGLFTYDGRPYAFKVNEFETHSHIHGFAHDRPWQIARAELCGPDAVVAETLFTGNPHMDFYSSFPHEFEIRATYKLSPHGLSHEIKVTNQSPQNMPIAIGIHTALRVPFHSAGEAESTVLKMAIDKRWNLTEAYMNTDELAPLDPRDQKLLNEGLLPLEKPFVSHYTAKAFPYKGREYHGTVLEDLKNKIRVCYETGSKYGHWVIWNDDAKKGFICPEPQTCAINAPNLKRHKDQSGFIGIAPGETWCETTKIYAEPM